MHLGSYDQLSAAGADAVLTYAALDLAQLWHRQNGTKS